MRGAALALAILLGLTEGGPFISIGAPSGWRVVVPIDHVGAAVAATQAEMLAKAQAMRTLTAQMADFPVYPGAKASAQPMPSMALIPGSPYTIDLYREWRVPAGMLTVRDWVEQAAGHRGWVAGDGAVLGYVQTPLVAEGYGVSFTRSRSAQVPEVEVSLVPPAGGVALLPILSPPDHGPTLIRYDAVTIWTPPRPAASLAPKHIAGVDLTLWRGPGSPVVVSLTDPVRVARLAAAIDALPMDTDGRQECLSGGGAATIVLRPAGGREMTVSVDSACYTATVAGQYHLFDDGHRLWQAVLDAVGGAGSGG